jgi:tetratricopeptide (TPR) repeat protein
MCQDRNDRVALGISLIKLFEVKQMKTRLLGWTAFVFIVIFVVSCTANLEVRKKQEVASRNLGEAYLRKGDYTSALREFLKAETLYPDDPYLQNDLGLTYMGKNKVDLAVKHFKKAIKIKPDYAPAINNLGTAYLNKKEWDTAITYFKEVANNLIYTTPHFPLSNLGWAYYNKKEYALAEKYYLDALKIEPKFINALLGLGQTYIALGRIPEAVAILKKAVNIYPRFAQLYLELAKAYTLSRDYKKALAAYKKIAEIAPGSPIALEAESKAQGIRNLR